MMDARYRRRTVRKQMEIKMKTNHKVIIGDSRRMKKYKCKHCEGISQIAIIRDAEKATEPTIEFCPFCGMSNVYPEEVERNENG